MKFEKNVLPDGLPPRPGMNDPAVEAEWVKIISEYIPENGASRSEIISAVEYFVTTPDMDSLLAYNLIDYLNENCNSDYFISNNDLAILASKMEPALKAAHEKVVREWVIATGIRFRGKEGDGVELLDPETGMPKMGTVMAVFAPRASALIKYRDKNEKSRIEEIGAERITKFYKEGKPSPNNPRGGKVGFQSEEFTNARMAA